MCMEAGTSLLRHGDEAALLCASALVTILALVVSASTGARLYSNGAIAAGLSTCATIFMCTNIRCAGVAAASNASGAGCSAPVPILYQDHAAPQPGL